MVRAGFKKGGKVRLQDISLRALRPDEIRLQVSWCGICGTDLHINPEETEEAGFGHEMAGIVTEVGSAVTRVAVGDKVAIESSSACGQCDHCRNTEQELCTNVQSFFILRYYGFAEETIVPAISAVSTQGVPLDVACLSEPLGVAIDMVRVSHIGPRSNVVVMGAGAIGLMAVALAKAHGARRIFMVSPKRRPKRLEIAKAFGADDVFDPAEIIEKDFSFGCEIDRMMVTSPPPSLKPALELIARTGIISLIGIGYGPAASIDFDVNAFHFKKLQLHASFASPALYTPMALTYLREGVVDGQAIISHRFKLDKLAEAMRTAREATDAVKVLVQP